MAGRQNREILTGGKKYAQKKAKKHAVEEVSFDKDSRQEYLTGFHKRKLERQKKAQEFHKEQDRLAKIEERKQNKLEKQKEMAKQMEKFQKNIKELSGQYEDSSEEDSDDVEDEKEETNGKIQDGDEDEEFEEWSGFVESKDEEPKTKGILKRIYASENGLPSPRNGSKSENEDDEDFTTVTIEDVEMNNSLEEIAKLNYVNLQKSQKILDESIDRAKKYAALVNGGKPKKAPKKKFRYLTKSERRSNNRKAIDNKKKSRHRD